MLIDAAVKLHVILDRKEIDIFFELVSGQIAKIPEYEDAQRKADKVWRWGLNRWGMKWSNLDCQLRDGFAAEYYADK